MYWFTLEELREKNTLVSFINECTAIIFLNCVPNARKMSSFVVFFFATVVFYAVFVMLCVVDMKGN